MTKAAFLGRFQPFHKGHKKVVENQRQEFEDLTIVICDEESRTEENPLNFQERKEIIENCFPELEILTLENYENDKEWMEKLKEKADPDVIISRSDWTNEAVEQSSELEVVEQELHDREIYSGTEARRRIRSGEEWRYLVPRCAKQKIEELVEVFKNSGTQYEFEPGWKPENAYHDTADK